jgi:hypothetical protein
LAAAGLRLSGIGYLLPGVMNRDGLVLVRQVEMLRGGTVPVSGDDWRYAFYPHLMARIAALLPQEPASLEGSADLGRHLELASAPWIRLRVISVLLSLIAVPGTYLLARRFVDRGSSLFAAALVATSLHHIVVSIQEKPHAAATSFITLALLAALRLRRRPDALSFLACGLAAGFAIGTLQNAAVCLLPVAAAFVLRERGERRVSGWWLAATVAMLALSARVFYPFFFDPSGIAGSAAAGGEELGVLGFAGKLLSRFHGAPCSKILAAVWALDPFLVTAAALGTSVWILDRIRDPARWKEVLRGDLAVLLALVGPYVLVLVSYRETLVRFCLPFLPLLACAAAFAFQRARERWLSRLANETARRATGAALGLVLLALPLWPALHFARIRCRPGPLEEAARWIEAHVSPDETVVVVPNFDLPLLPTVDAIGLNASLANRTIWSEYLAHAPPETLQGVRRPILVEPGSRPTSLVDFTTDPLAYLRSFDARYVVLDLSAFPNGYLRTRTDLATRISPALVDDGRNRGVALWGTGYDPLRPSAASILRLRSLGTTVEIYRIP